MGRRENTFRIDFSNVPKKPDVAKVHKFCATVLGLKQGEVLRIQNSRSLGVTFVKVVDLALAQRICEEHNNQHEISVDGKKYPLSITLEDGAVEVRLYDLSEGVSEQKITEFLEKYGDVLEIREQRSGADVDFPGVSTGVRIVKMIVERNIESWVTIDGEMTAVVYFGQRTTCRHCRDYAHVGVTCVQNKKLLVQKSYADAAKQSPTAQQQQVKIAAGANQTKQSNQTALKANNTTTNSTVTESMPPPKQIPQANQQPPQLDWPSLPAPTTVTTEQSPPSGSGSVTAASGQQPPTSNVKVRKPTSDANDGNDTDSSVGSSSSKRQLRNRQPPPGKKSRLEDEDNKRGRGNQPS